MGVFLSDTHADVTLPAIFGDHMVLQRDVTLPIWGKADPGEHVRVLIAGQFAQATANGVGNWRVTLRPLTASSTPETLIVEGRNRIEIQDVLLGDVWICAGEGNMSFPLSDATGGKDTPQAMSDPSLRFFVGTNQPSLTPDTHGSGSWIVCTPETVASFSAVGYFFARDVMSADHLPIGMIQCTADDSSAPSWISRQGLAERPAFSNHLVELAQAIHSAENSLPDAMEVSANTPSSLFNNMIAPLIPYAITGVLWYQGESDEGLGALEYRRLLVRLIRDWRKQWGEGPFAFYFVLPAGFGGGDGPVVESFYGENQLPGRGLPWLREGMACALSLPNTGMAVATDLGMSDERRPPDKLDVGRRLAYLARRRIYGEDIVDSGPIYRGMKIEGGKVRVTFDSVGSGLTLGISPFQIADTNSPEDSTISEADADANHSFLTQFKGLAPNLRGFALAGTGGKWFPATGRIEGDDVILSSDAVPYPREVRYNWRGFPSGNLYNKEGLPAAPFRSDSRQPDDAR